MGSQVQNSTSSSGGVIDSRNLFWLMHFVRGVQGKYESLPTPDDLVLQHKEQVTFQNPKTGSFHLSHDFRNCILSCQSFMHQANLVNMFG